jgi:hypothetical protein
MGSGVPIIEKIDRRSGWRPSEVVVEAIQGKVQSSSVVGAVVLASVPVGCS